MHLCLILVAEFRFGSRGQDITEAERQKLGMISQPYENMMIDMKSRIFCSYRQDFEQLPGSILSSDVGWGCMIRVGQMLIAQALSVHLLRREWTYSPSTQENHRPIVRLFGDASGADFTFSIHNLLRHLERIGKHITIVKIMQLFFLINFLIRSLL